jgi:hypothetical protein
VQASPVRAYASEDGELKEAVFRFFSDNFGAEPSAGAPSCGGPGRRARYSSAGRLQGRSFRHEAPGVVVVPKTSAVQATIDGKLAAQPDARRHQSNGCKEGDSNARTEAHDEALQSPVCRLSMPVHDWPLRLASRRKVHDLGRRSEKTLLRGSQGLETLPHRLQHGVGNRLKLLGQVMFVVDAGMAGF